MLKTMKNQMLPERGEGCRCKGKTPKTFMCMCIQMETCIQDFLSFVVISYRGTTEVDLCNQFNDSS